LIRIRRLCKEYPGGTRALDDVSLDIVDGEFVALIGPSGAGKSSFLRCVNGLVTPTSGEVIVDGHAVTGAPDDRLRQVRARIGFVFQQFNLLRRLTVLQNVLVGRLAHTSRWRSVIGWFDAIDVARTRAVLGRIGLEGLADRRVDTLSGGQQQRVAIARALVTRPAIVVADEPTGNLDEDTGKQIIELLFAGHARRKSTLVLVTHDPALAARCARVVRLRSGRIDGVGVS